MGKDNHIIWFKCDNWHQGDEYGCFFRHGYVADKGEKYPKCYYPENSYEISKTRANVYNNGLHYARALSYGHLFGDSTDKLINARAKELNDRYRLKNPARDGTDRRYRIGFTPKESLWKSTMKNMLQSSIDLLKVDNHAWYIKHKISVAVKPWWKPNAAAQKPPADNFKPAKLADGSRGGWSHYFPYKHNHHHIIPIDAFYKYVIEKGNEKISRSKKTELVLASNWNINFKKNLIMLPNEIPAAEIVGLPAHCPWGTRNHTKYSNSMKKELKKVNKQLKKATKHEECKEIKKIKVELEDVSKVMYKKIIKLETGPNLSN